MRGLRYGARAEGSAVYSRLTGLPPVSSPCCVECALAPSKGASAQPLRPLLALGSRSKLPWDRNKAALTDLHYAAFALEPSFLDVSIFGMEDVMQGFNTVIFCMSSAHPLKEEADSWAIKEFEIFCAKQGMFGRQSVDRMIDKPPSCQWFQQFGAGVPHLQYSAVRILAMQSGAAAPGRFYSKLGWIKSKTRNRLGHQKTEKLLFVHLNFVLKHKIESLEYEEAAKVQHTLGESYLDDAGVEIEPMKLLDEYEDETVDETWQMHGSTLWGITDEDVQSEQ